MDWAAGATELLWIGGLTALPLALVVMLASRWPGCRPATRHAMWAAVLVSFLTPAVATLVWRPTWFSSGKLLAAAGTALERIREELRFEVAVTPPPLPPPPRTASTQPAAPPARQGHLAPLAAKEPVASMKERRGEAKPGMAKREESAGSAGSEKAKKNAAREGSGKEPAASTKPKTASEKSEKANAPTTGAARRAGEEKNGGTRNDPDNGGRAAPSSAVAPGSESAAPASAPEEPAWTAEVKTWVAQAVNVRDAVAALPPLPVEIWASGMALLVGVWVVKVIGVRRALRHARPATGGTKEQVEEAARELGMRRAPRTLVTGSRVSPMVLCGVRPTLVLPTGLWRELDGASRRAVLLHELAHLRRRDHWLSWLASLVGVVYWWHPVAWWARRRVRDEADAACDAWVTSLMPASRRCYAEALVTTKWFLSCPGRRVPSGLVGVGTLGVMTGRTKHLARRLKMVMTQRVAPRSSWAGALVALGVMAAGMFVMPSLACPPEETAKNQAAAKALAAAAKETAKAQKARAEKAEKAAAAGKNVEFFGEAPALEAMRRAEAEKRAERGDGDREDAIMRRLEERMRRLEDQIRELERGMQNRGGGAGAGPRSMNVAPTPSTPPTPPTVVRRAPGAMAVTVPGGAGRGPVVAVGPMAASGATAPRAPHAVAVPGQPAQPAMPHGMAMARTPRPEGMGGESGEEVVREYRLPDGKLEALTALMSREDVPVLIERYPDKIVVHAPESKQRIFAAFVRLIHPEAGIPAGALPRANKVEQTKVKVEREEQAKKAQELRTKMKDVEKKQRDAEKAAEKARQRSDATVEQTDQIREQIEALTERMSGDAGEAEKGKLEAEVAKLTARLTERASEIAKYAAEAEAKEAILEALEESLGELESAIESLDEEMNNADDTDVIEIELPALPEEGEAPAATPEPAVTDVPVAIPVPSAAPVATPAAVPQPTPAPLAPVGVVPAVAPPAAPTTPAPTAPPVAPVPVRA